MGKGGLNAVHIVVLSINATISIREFNESTGEEALLARMTVNTLPVAND